MKTSEKPYNIDDFGEESGIPQLLATTGYLEYMNTEQVVSLASELLTNDPPETLREIILRQDVINQNNPLQPQQSNSPNSLVFQDPFKQGLEPITEFFEAIKNYINTNSFTLDGQNISISRCVIKMEVQKNFNGQNYDIACDIKGKDGNQGAC